jgi:hypothetical protein
VGPNLGRRQFQIGEWEIFPSGSDTDPDAVRSELDLRILDYDVEHSSISGDRDGAAVLCVQQLPALRRPKGVDKAEVENAVGPANRPGRRENFAVFQVPYVLSQACPDSPTKALRQTDLVSSGLGIDLREFEVENSSSINRGWCAVSPHRLTSDNCFDPTSAL